MPCYGKRYHSSAIIFFPLPCRQRKVLESRSAADDERVRPSRGLPLKMVFKCARKGAIIKNCVGKGSGPFVDFISL